MNSTLLSHPGANVGRTLGQKIAFGSAILFYLLGAGCIGAAVLYTPQSEVDPVRASLMASVIFFGGAGFVLHVIGSARVKGILSGRDHYVYESDHDRPEKS